MLLVGEGKDIASMGTALLKLRGLLYYRVNQCVLIIPFN